MARLIQPLTLTRATPIHPIGAAARLTGLPVWTLRWIEKNGLLAPRRTPGRHRLFSEEDLELLRTIRGLMKERVNLAGIRVILRMRLSHGLAVPAAAKALLKER